MGIAGSGRALATMLVILGACSGAPNRDEGAVESDTSTGTTSVQPPGAPTRTPASAETGDGSSSTAPDTDLSEDSSWTAGIVSVDRDGRGAAVLREVRIAAHDGYDRIVLDFGDARAPGYRVSYVDRPVRACGSGEAVELPGDGWLSIDLRPAAAHDDQGYATVRSRDLATDLPAVLRLRSTCDFEAVVTWVAAVRSPNRFRVTELADPTRVVVDVRH